MGQLVTEDNPLTKLISFILPVRQEDIDALFNIGVRLYESVQYEAASRFFLLICMTRPFNASYLCAYAKSRKMMNDFELAASIFQLAFLLDRHSAEYAVHAAECLLRCGRKAEAMPLLETAKNDPLLAANHSGIHERARAWLELIASDHKANK